MSEILLGSHVGMSGKEMFLGSVKEAAEYGANALMVYTGAPQNTRRKEIGELRLDEGLAYAEKAGIREIIIHAPYIINLGNMEKPEMFDFGVDFLAKEVKRTAAFHSKVLVLHPGSSLSAGVEASVEQIAVIHVNDSLNPLGAHKDRHANIGQGTIGYETLHRIVHDERFAGVPKILETPWLCAEGETKKTIPPYKQEIAWLLQ